MRKRRRFDARRLDVQFASERDATRKFDNKSEHGREIIYNVTDRNLQQQNRWVCSVFVKNNGDVAVCPTFDGIPREKLQELGRRSVMFMLATKARHRSKYYCKTWVSDVEGTRISKTLLKWDNMRYAPPWFKRFDGRLFRKREIKQDCGNDREHPVILVDRDDYPEMIRVYFALRVWVLLDKYKVPRVVSC